MKALVAALAMTVAGAVPAWAQSDVPLPSASTPASEAARASAEAERKRVDPIVRSYFLALDKSELDPARAPARGYIVRSRTAMEPVTLAGLRSAFAGCEYITVAHLTDLSSGWEGYQAAFRCPNGTKTELRTADFVVIGENIDDVRVILPSALRAGQ